jgi:hypothetical protein
MTTLQGPTGPVGPTGPANLTFTAPREVLTESSHKGVWVSVPEMRRIQRRINAIREPIQWIRNLGWACIALAPAAILAWLPWAATYGSLPVAVRLDWAWVTPAMLLTALAALVIAVVCFFMNRAHQTEIVRDKRAALDVLDSIAERYGLPSGFENGQSTSPAISSQDQT